jgi:hypothetical protein
MIDTPVCVALVGGYIVRVAPDGAIDRIVGDAGEERRDLPVCWTRSEDTFSRQNQLLGYEKLD